MDSINFFIVVYHMLALHLESKSETIYFGTYTMLSSTILNMIGSFVTDFANSEQWHQRHLELKNITKLPFLSFVLVETYYSVY